MTIDEKERKVIVWRVGGVGEGTEQLGTRMVGQNFHFSHCGQAVTGSHGAGTPFSTKGCKNVHKVGT